MIDLGPHLGIDGESTIEFVSRFGKESQSKFPLEHKDADSRRWGGREEFEGERRGNLVAGLETSQKKPIYIYIYICTPAYLIWGIANANIEIRKICFDHISQNDIQAWLRWCTLNTLGNFRCHSRIQFHSDDLLGFLEDLDREVTCTGTDFKNDL